jgi:hypothetical protein
MRRTNTAAPQGRRNADAVVRACDQQERRTRMGLEPRAPRAQIGMLDFGRMLARECAEDPRLRVLRPGGQTGLLSDHGYVRW